MSSRQSQGQIYWKCTNISTNISNAEFSCSRRALWGQQGWNSPHLVNSKSSPTSSATREAGLSARESPRSVPSYLGTLQISKMQSKIATQCMETNVTSSKATAWIERANGSSPPVSNLNLRVDLRVSSTASTGYSHSQSSQSESQKLSQKYPRELRAPIFAS